MVWSDELPEIAGNYVVKTETDFLGKELVMLATLNISDKGEKSWNFKNQKFKAYLKYDEV